MKATFTMLPKLLLIDTSSLLYRAYHALPPLSTSTGQPTHAAYGFTGMLLRLLQEESPEAVALALDTPHPTFRHREFAAYKAHRPTIPDDLAAQIPIVREVVAAFEIPLFEREGYEADDLLGSLAVQAEGNYEVLVVTGDRDLLQLVAPHIQVLVTRQGITKMDRFDLAAVEARYGVRPDQIAALKALTGDSSDNIPGVPGIGEKTAVRLLQRYGTLETLLQNISQIHNPRVRQGLEKYAEQVRLSHRLATIRTDLALEFNASDLRRRPLNPSRLQEVFAKYQFHSLRQRLDAGEPQQRTLF